MSKLFDLFFSLLNESKIEYAITGRTENYPDKIHSDIDIIIPSNKWYLFKDFMHNLNKYNLDWIQVISHEITANYNIISLSDGTKYHILKPDVCSDYYRNGTLFLKAEHLLLNRVYNDKGFFQLSPQKEFIYYLLKKIDKGSITLEQFIHIQTQYDINKTECIKEINLFFPPLCHQIIINAFEQKEISILENNLDYIKQGIHQNLSFNFKDNIFQFFNKIKRITYPTGCIIAFMGPDGCGKTTVINAVKEDLTDAFRKNKQFHLFPKESCETAINTNPHGLKQRGFLCSLLKLFYFLGLYTIGYWSKVYPLKIRSTLIIFDRYFHDILVDPKRYRHSGGVIWIKIIGFFIPKPDLWILLDAPAEVIQQRKMEVTFEETSFQVNEYRQLFSKLSNAITINANQPLEQVIYDTERAIIEHLKKRTLLRY